MKKQVFEKIRTYGVTVVMIGSFLVGCAGKESVTTVDSFEDGTVIGHMEDGLKIAFVPKEDADPDNFDAQNYISLENGGDLIFEMTAHTSGDDAIDIPVSDALATIIDSLEFIQY